MTNTKCKYYRTPECPEENQPLIICNLCKHGDSFIRQEFEAFCGKNDLEYDFGFYSGGKYYSNSETNKAFFIFKWARREE